MLLSILMSCYISKVFMCVAFNKLGYYRLILLLKWSKEFLNSSNYASLRKQKDKNTNHGTFKVKVLFISFIREQIKVELKLCLKSNYESTCNTKLTKQLKTRSSALYFVHHCEVLLIFMVLWKSVTYLANTVVREKHCNVTKHVHNQTFQSWIKHVDKPVSWEFLHVTKDQLKNEISINWWRKHTLLSSISYVMPASV